MAERKRAVLKNIFQKGKIPTEQDFHSLIDSCLNKLDDGVAKTKGEGLKLQADGKQEELLSFYHNIKDLNPTWIISHLTDDGAQGLNISEPNGGSRFFIEQGGNVGIGITRPQQRLEVDGVVAMEGRIGNFAHGQVPADGKWHDLVVELNGFQAFEIIATASIKGSHAILHAIALSAYGKSRPAINKTCGYFGSLRSKLDLRWTGDYFNYKLQARTKKDYGDGVSISYNLSRLI